MTRALEELTALLRLAREVADGNLDLDDHERQDLADSLARELRRSGARVADIHWSSPVDLEIELVPRDEARN